MNWKAALFTGLLLGPGLVFAQNEQQDPAPEEPPPGWWLLPKTDTRLKLGGYVKFDLIHDFNPIESPDFFDVSKIPTDGSEGQQTNLNAKETRLFLDARQPSKIGELRVYVEGDFYGTSGAFRLRHAFLELGKHWMGGQWWSNFMDESMIPPTLDFEKPGAYAFARHPMLRYKAFFSDKAYLAIALEQPSSNAEAPTAAGEFESHWPDLTARYRLTGAWGHLQLSAFAAILTYRFDTGGTDNLTLAGANLSGSFNLFTADKFSYQVLYGPGIGRMRGGLSAAPDANGDLEALSDFGFTVTYLHSWSPKFTSLVVFNYGDVSNTGGQDESDVSNVFYGAVNLIWHVTSAAFVGIEYLHGMREDISSASGSANRVQFSMKYAFNAH